MKKILSFVLVLAMIASMMCISVSADNFIGTYKGVDQEGNSLGTVEDGVAEGQANGTTGALPVYAHISSNVVNRYAVDLTYTVSDITLAGDTVWDVNTMKYVNGSADNDAETKAITIKTTFMQEAATVVDGEENKIQVAKFDLTNYSDLSVVVTLTPAKIASAASLVVTADEGTPVNGAYDGTAANSAATAKEASYSAYIASTNWAETLAQLDKAEKNQDDNSVTIATYTFEVRAAN